MTSWGAWRAQRARGFHKSKPATSGARGDELALWPATWNSGRGPGRDAGWLGPAARAWPDRRTEVMPPDATMMT